MDAGNGYSEVLEKQVYQFSITAVPRGWQKYIDLNGDYIEK